MHVQVSHHASHSWLPAYHRSSTTLLFSTKICFIYPDGATYLVSYHSGAPTIGPANELPNPNTSKMSAFVRLRYGKSETMFFWFRRIAIIPISFALSLKIYVICLLDWSSLASCRCVVEKQVTRGTVMTYTRAFVNDVPEADYFNDYNPINVYNFRSAVEYNSLPSIKDIKLYKFFTLEILPDKLFYDFHHAMIVAATSLRPSHMLCCQICCPPQPTPTLWETDLFGPRRSSSPHCPGQKIQNPSVVYTNRLWLPIDDSHSLMIVTMIMTVQWSNDEWYIFWLGNHALTFLSVCTTQCFQQNGVPTSHRSRWGSRPDCQLLTNSGPSDCQQASGHNQRGGSQLCWPLLSMGRAYPKSGRRNVRSATLGLFHPALDLALLQSAPNPRDWESRARNWRHQCRTQFQFHYLPIPI